jgi:uncharacterized protein YkwD
MRQRVLIALAATVGLVVSGFVVSATAATSPPATRYAVAVVKATNAQRVGHHRAKVGFDACLKRLATAQAARMARQGRLSHQSMTAALRTCRLRAVAENVGTCFRSGTALVNSGWMNSTPHRTNLLNGRYHRMAVTARWGNGCWWVAQVFGTRR